MKEILSSQWPCQVDWKPAGEDAFIAEKRSGVFAVAHGVTRRGFTGAYPYPSPARQAADAVVETIGAISAGVSMDIDGTCEG